MKYLAVYHRWFVSSGKWDHEFIETTSQRRAEEIAALNCSEKLDSWELDHIDYKVFPIEENDILKVKLTFKERLKGVIKLESSITNLKFKKKIK